MFLTDTQIVLKYPDKLVLIYDTRRYGPLRRPIFSFRLGPGFFGPLGKKGLIMLFLPILGHFWCAVVTLVTFSNNLNNFEKNLET